MCLLPFLSPKKLWDEENRRTFFKATVPVSAEPWPEQTFITGLPTAHDDVDLLPQRLKPSGSVHFIYLSPLQATQSILYISRFLPLSLQFCVFNCFSSVSIFPVHANPQILGWNTILPTRMSKWIIGCFIKNGAYFIILIIYSSFNFLNSSN